MILIADSGSTKTSWAFCTKHQEVQYFTTIGYNPYFISVEDIKQNLSSSLPTYIPKESIEKIYFFGAGCTNSPSQSHIKNALGFVFPNAIINVDSDLLAACIALFGNGQGIACILGTGSNAGFFDGTHFTRPTKSLGYILGDEGSAAYIGRNFLNKYLRNQFSKETQLYFNNKMGLDEEAILDKVYRQEFPNRFLASILPIIAERKSDAQIHTLLSSSINDFIESFILSIPKHQEYKISFCGGTAFRLHDLIIEICHKHKIQFDKIIQQPIEELVEFYTKRLS